MTPYLLPSEYAQYGLDDGQQVTGACLLIDSALGARQGLLYTAGTDNRPCYMTNAVPTSAYVLAAPLVAGSTTVTIPAARFPGLMVGEVAVIGRSEACVVISASGDTLTLEATQYDHPAGTLVEFGLAAEEACDLSPDGMAHARVSPVARVLSVAGVYRPRPGISQPIDPFTQFRYSQSQFWTYFPTSQCDIAGGSVRLLQGTTPGGFTCLRLRMVTGWTQANLPPAIKQAVAITAGTLAANEMPADAKMVKAGDSTVERFGANPVPPAALALLSPYMTYRL